VEDRHYPDLPPVPRQSLVQTFIDTANFFGVLIAANLLAVLAYGFAGPAAPLVFWALNGYLLGREYFQLAAMRRLGRAGAKALRKRHFFQVWMAGILMAVPLSVPLVNFLVPVLGAATFTHLFHRVLNQRPD
jgi:CysZ protein